MQKMHAIKLYQIYVRLSTTIMNNFKKSTSIGWRCSGYYIYICWILFTNNYPALWSFYFSKASSCKRLIKLLSNRANLCLAVEYVHLAVVRDSAYRRYNSCSTACARLCELVKIVYEDVSSSTSIPRYSFATCISEYLVILGSIDGEKGVTNLLSFVIPKKFAAPTSSIFVWVAGSR